MSNPTFILWAPTLSVMAADDLFPIEHAGDLVEASDVDKRVFQASVKMAEEFIGNCLNTLGEWRNTQQIGNYDFDEALDIMSKCPLGAVEFALPYASIRIMWTCSI